MKTNRFAHRLTAAALFVVPAALIGCSSSGPKHAGDIDAIRSNPSPAMHTLARREADELNAQAYTRDTNTRELWEDIDMMFFLDRPSRLHRGVNP